MNGRTVGGSVSGDLHGGEPAVWDALSEENEEQTVEGLYPLRSAPERAILHAALELTDLQPGERVTELGCGAARYLPYLARRGGVRVAGVDFSEAGVAQTKRALDSLGLDTSGVVLADLRAYCPQHPDEFDAVFSFGLIEHFSDLREIVNLHFVCARPGGRVFMSAPNLSGPNLGWARRVAPDLLTWHCELAASDVVSACRSIGAINLEVVYLGGPRLFAYPQRADRSLLSFLLALVARKVFNGGGQVLYRLSPSLARRIAGESLSPFFAVAATKPGE
jgi:SAM-dependent methyltransferase